ncbi:MAG TPA: hypothetical protein VFB63_19370 [Bryobacteraceae bacterium]|nr:hypothetical protein [Bryobacteraceae bacterium]
MKMLCEVEGCGEELTEGCGSKGGPMMCAQCRTSSYYWKKQSLPAMRYRRERLSLFSHRLEHYDPRVAQIINDANKSVAGTKRRAQAASSIPKPH